MFPDEPDLIARSQGGEVQAFNLLVERYQNRLYALSYRMLGDADSAADVTQDVFFSAYRNIGRYRGGSFVAWLLRIATNACYDQLRARKRRPQTSLDAFDPEAGEMRYAIQIPKMLSFLASHDFNAEVKGLNDFPPDQRPNTVITHIAFQIMVGCGFALVGLGLWFWFAYWRLKSIENRWLLRALVAGSPLGFLALEAGWIVTEVGRQPWVIYEVMRTSEGVTTATDVGFTFAIFTLLYLGLGIVLIFLLRYLATGAPPSLAHGPVKKGVPDAA